jgi:hypothetical protein
MWQIELRRRRAIGLVHGHEEIDNSQVTPLLTDLARETIFRFLERLPPL